jgi:hypothetical protein
MMKNFVKYDQKIKKGNKSMIRRKKRKNILLFFNWKFQNNDALLFYRETLVRGENES